MFIFWDDGYKDLIDLEIRGTFEIHPKENKTLSTLIPLTQKLEFGGFTISPIVNQVVK